MHDATRSEAKEAQFAFAPAEDRRAPTGGGEEAQRPWTRVAKPAVARAKEAVPKVRNPAVIAMRPWTRVAKPTVAKAKEAAAASTRTRVHEPWPGKQCCQQLSSKARDGKGCSELAPKPWP